MPGEILDEEVCVVEEATDYAAAGGDVGEEKTPGGDGAEPGREDVAGIGVERAWGGRVTGKLRDAQRHQQDRDGRKRVGQPSAIAGQCAHERNGGRRRGRWRYGRNRLR